MNVGIDYGMGRTNVDVETGIRYGVISQHSISQAWSDSAEPDYGKPSCPKCGNEALSIDKCESEDVENWDCAEHECSDYVCESCQYVFGSESAFGDEPQGWNYEGDGYVLTDCLDSDVIVIKSEFYTLGNYCSPCVPGAVSLESDNPDGAKAYCLSHDWFEDGKAPYPVYRVDNGQEVLPEKAAA